MALLAKLNSRHLTMKDSSIAASFAVSSISIIPSDDTRWIDVEANLFKLAAWSIFKRVSCVIVSNLPATRASSVYQQFKYSSQNRGPWSIIHEARWFGKFRLTHTIREPSTKRNRLSRLIWIRLGRLFQGNSAHDARSHRVGLGWIGRTPWIYIKWSVW